MVIEDVDIYKSVELDCARLDLRSDGILHIHIKKEMSFEIEDSKEIHKTRLELVGEKSTPVLYTGQKLVIPSKEVSEYMASDERSQKILADAFIIRSLAQRIAVNIYIKFNKPTIPTKFFENKDKAVAWLSTFL